MAVLTDIEIARQNKMVPIEEIAEKLSLGDQSLHKFGHHIAKIDTDKIGSDSKNGKLILVTAISPTPAGEGKTTTSVGLNDALNNLHPTFPAFSAKEQYISVSLFIIYLL